MLKLWQIRCSETGEIRGEIMEQMEMDLFNVEIITYPKITNLRITKTQMAFIINAIEVYENRLKKIELNEVGFDFNKKRELKEIRILLEYLEDKIYGGNKKNRRINNMRDEDIGLDPFNLIGE